MLKNKKRKNKKKRKTWRCPWEKWWHRLRLIKQRPTGKEPRLLLRLVIMTMMAQIKKKLTLISNKWKNWRKRGTEKSKRASNILNKSKISRTMLTNKMSCGSRKPKQNLMKSKKLKSKTPNWRPPSNMKLPWDTWKNKKPPTKDKWSMSNHQHLRKSQTNSAKSKNWWRLNRRKNKNGLRSARGKLRQLPAVNQR